MSFKSILNVVEAVHGHAQAVLVRPLHKSLAFVFSKIDTDQAAWASRVLNDELLIEQLEYMCEDFPLFSIDGRIKHAEQVLKALEHADMRAR